MEWKRVEIDSLDIYYKSNIAIFDLCLSGTIQFYLSKLINKKVYGFYLATMNFPNLFYKDKCNILYYVDNNLMKQGRLFNGKMVKSPNKQTLEGKKILICSMLYANEIKEQIDKMKIDCKVEII